MNDRSQFFLRLQEVCKRFGLGKSTIWLRVDQGLLPKPVHVGERAVAWPDVEILAIQKAVMAGYDQDQIKNLVRELLDKRKMAIT